MNEILFSIMVIFLFALVFLGIRFFIPWIKEKIGNEKYERVKAEIQTLVYAIQERYGKELTGPERRAIVLEKIKEFLISKNISLTDDQLRELNDAAVFAMKLAQIK
jgi:uncharacterized membrane protein